MKEAPPRNRDPIALTAIVAFGFAILCSIRLTTPSAPFFDEVHYLPPARTLLELSHPLNPEHPPLGKQLIALGMALFGDNPLGWRFMSALFGTIALVAGMRGLWFATLSRGASIGGGVLLATGFPLLVQSRIAMLDIFMAAFVLVALWMCAAALRQNEQARWRLAIAGTALGCAMASKWNAIPLAMLPGLAFLVIRGVNSGRQFLVATRAAPLPGITLMEAALWLGLLPLAVYFASYWPLPLYSEHAIPVAGLSALQWQMYGLQTQPLDTHLYQSRWYEWMSNWRAIWYLYEDIDGAQRGVMLIGNPLTMLLGLPALLWCGWTGMTRRRWDALAIAILYLASLGLWIFAHKNVQFYYHYLLPSCFLLAALALALNDLWRRGLKKTVLAVYVAAIGLTIYFWPILTAATLEGGRAFERWAWLDSWR